MQNNTTIGPVTSILWSGARAQDLLRSIKAIPCSGAEFVVTVDGKPYAGFIDRAYAEMAVSLWSGELDGRGLPIPVEERTERGWPAARGRRLAIVEQRARRIDPSGPGRGAI
jgi:hypothetical protein